MSSSIAITTGEPAGIGPEICVKAVFTGRVKSPVTLIGDKKLLIKTSEKLGFGSIFPDWVKFEHVPLAHPAVPGQLDVANATYGNWLQERQQNYITRFVQEASNDNPQASKQFAQAVRLGQMQGKDALETERLATTLMKSKVLLQATLIAMKDITGSTVWLCLGSTLLVLFVPYHKKERT